MNRVVGALRSVPAILWLLVAALGLRGLLAYGLFAGSGFRFDIGSFVGWAQTLARYGPGGFYANAGFADYPPAYLYVLWAIGSAGQLVSDVVGGGTIHFAGEDWTIDYVVDAAAVKVPAILADLGVGLLIYGLVRRWAPGRGERVALGAACLYLFNPVTWYDSALWGQMDAVGALVMLVSIALLIEGLSEGAAATAVLAALVKPQFGVVLFIVIGVVLLRRHLFRAGSGPRTDDRPGRFVRLRTWLHDEQGPVRLATSAVAGALVFVVIATPFGLDPVGLLRRMADTAAGYPYLTVYADNPWALVGAGGRDALAWSTPVLPSSSDPNVILSPDTVPVLGPLTGVTVGASLLLLAFAIAAIQLAMRDSRRSILLAVTFLAFAFFVLPTRVHERYVFPVFAFLPLLAVGSRSFTVLTVAAAAASLVNLHGVLTAPTAGTADLQALPFGEAARSAPGIVASAVVTTACLAYLLWRLRPAADLVVDPVRRALGRPPRPPDDDPFDAGDPFDPGYAMTRSSGTSSATAG